MGLVDSDTLEVALGGADPPVLQEDAIWTDLCKDRSDIVDLPVLGAYCFVAVIA